MKKFNHTKIFNKSTIFIGILLSIILTANLFHMAVTAYTEKKYYPEPDVRPNIRKDAVWDTELGMYISGDYVKNENNEYELRQDIFVSEKAESPEQKWQIEHEGSENEIDKAIFASIDVARTQPPSLYSSISPRSSNAILSTMGNLPLSSYPELWERICTEPAYRAQKIVAMELFLGVPVGEVGLYDDWGQKEWYKIFTEMKNNLPDGIITQNQVEEYGNLLLPALCKKLEDNTLEYSEQMLITEMMNEISVQSGLDVDSGELVETTIDATEWLSEQKELIKILNQIIESDYQWVE